ncbi:MAG TPA: hypothetical protein VFX32_06610 [Pseudolabrys sp.]|nr:hypothetical protein [Pseudolabrys sp.]
MTDIDAQFQRGGRYDDSIFPRLEFLFDFQSSLARQAAVMRADLALAQPFSQLVRYALDQATRIDEDQGRAVGLDLFDELVVNGRPDILANDRSKLLIRNFNTKIHVAAVADVDDRAISCTVRSYMLRSDEKPRDFFDRLLRGAQADALQRAAGQGVETFERERQMSPALVLRHCMYLVDDQGLGRL